VILLISNSSTARDIHFSLVTPPEEANNFAVLDRVNSTGLGLSLAYDIIKAHSGEIKVETKEGEDTEFTVRLPVKDM